MRQRTEYDAEYVTIGSMPGLIKDSFEHGDDDIVRKLLCDSLVLSRRGRETKEVDEYSRFVSALFLEISPTRPDAVAYVGDRTGSNRRF